MNAILAALVLVDVTIGIADRSALAFVAAGCLVLAIVMRELGKRRANYLSSKQRAMIREARRRHAVVTPCSGRSWADSFLATPRGRLLLWYNGPDGSTHVVSDEEVA